MSRIRKPWRHFADQHRLANRLRPRACILVTQQRHRGRFARTMAALAPRLQNRLDIFVKGDFLRRGAQKQAARREYQGPGTKHLKPPKKVLPLSTRMKPVYRSKRRARLRFVD